MSLLEELSEQIRKRTAEVGVIALGKMGLPTAVAFAKAGFQVRGVDTNPAVIEAVRSGRSPYPEPGLEEALREVADRIDVSTDYRVLKGCSIIVNIVPTGLDSRRNPDYSGIGSSFKEAAKLASKPMLAVLESNVAPGVTEAIAMPAIESEGLAHGIDYLMAYVPIHGKAGRIMKDLYTYPRVVGGYTSEAAEAAELLFKEVFQVEVYRASSMAAAEASKVLGNVFRDINIAIANELAVYCMLKGLDAREVFKLASIVPTVSFLSPGPGVGGNCLPQDPYFIIKDSESQGFSLQLVKAAREVNERMPMFIAELAASLAPRGAQIAVLGLAYRGDVAETAFSPAIEVCKALAKMGFKVKAYDPYVDTVSLPGVEVAGSMAEAVEGAEVIVVATAHSEFRRSLRDLINRIAGRKATVLDAVGVIEGPLKVSLVRV